MNAARKVVLFFKSHVAQYVRKDGSVVSAHEDIRTKKMDAPKEPKQWKANEISEHDIPSYCHSDFKGGAAKFAGAFGLDAGKKRWEGYLVRLDDHDHKWIAASLKKPLREGEHILRYQSHATNAGGISPLVKINVHSKTVAFNESEDDDVITFGTPERAAYISAVRGRI